MLRKLYINTNLINKKTKSHTEKKKFREKLKIKVKEIYDFSMKKL